MGQKIMTIQVLVNVCDICGDEIKDSANTCSNCGNEVCNNCLAHWDEDHAVCKAPGCNQAVVVLQEWASCKKDGYRCEGCHAACSCSYSYVTNPSFLKFERYA